MHDHPDLLELELARTGEESAETRAHLEAGCALCARALAGLEGMAEAARGETPEIPIPPAVQAEIDRAMDGAVARARSVSDQRSDAAGRPAEGRGARVLRPRAWRRALYAMASLSAAAAACLIFVSFFGDNLRMLFGASADALAGDDRAVEAPTWQAHKGLSDFQASPGDTEARDAEKSLEGFETRRPSVEPRATSAAAPRDAPDLPAARAATSPTAMAKQDYRLTWLTAPDAPIVLSATLHLPRACEASATPLIEGDALSTRSDPGIGGETTLTLELRRDTRVRALAEARLTLRCPTHTPPAEVLAATASAHAGPRDVLLRVQAVRSP